MNESKLIVYRLPARNIGCGSPISMDSSKISKHRISDFQRPMRNTNIKEPLINS